MSAAADVGTCEAVWPAAEVKLYSGSDIDSAGTEAGETDKTRANAFRFQREIVPQCACSAGASTGLSPIAIEDDMMLRTGDIIAADDGFRIAAISSGQKRSVLFRPLSKAEAQALGLSRLSSRKTRSRALASFEYHAAVQNALLSGSQRRKISSQISSQLVLTQRTPEHALFSVDGCATILPSDLPHRPPPSSLRAFKINNRQAATACVGE